MNAREFVTNLYNEANDINILHDKKTAAEDLGHLRREGFDVPEDISPEDYARIWNELVLAECNEVVTPDGRCIPRYTQMTGRQVARAIMDADDWDQVADLVEHVGPSIGIPMDEGWHYAGDWESSIEDWCEKVLKGDLDEA